MRRETLLLVGDIKDAVVVTSTFFVQEFWFALRKRFAVEGWILCSTLGLTSGRRKRQCIPGTPSVLDGFGVVSLPLDP
jgi:hypothetical protein